MAAKIVGRDAGSPCLPQVPTASATAGSAQHPPNSNANGVDCERGKGGDGSAADSATAVTSAALGLKSQLLSRLLESMPAWSVSARANGEGPHDSGGGGGIVGV